jgi:four helix bundle protein
MSLASYRDLRVWQAAFELAVESHRIAARFPGTERFALAAQTRRSASSIPANIAEGYGRAHRGDYLHHLSIASGSLKELETHLLLASALEYVSPDGADALLRSTESVGKMLTALQRSLRIK